MHDEPGEESTDRAPPRAQDGTRRYRSLSASGAGQAQTLTRLPTGADGVMAAVADEDMAALPAATRNAAAAASPASTAGQAAAAAQSGRKRPSRRPGSQAHLAIVRVEPWPVMKFDFGVSLVAFVILFVAVSVVYSALSALGVFGSLQHFVSSITSDQTSAGINVTAWFSASRVLGFTALLGCLNVVLITAMSTIGAVVYNLTSRLTGGLEVTLRETQ